MSAQPKTAQAIAIKGTKPTRSFFGRTKEMDRLPNLIEIQLNSYKWFFERGLKDLLAEINPIRDLREKT